MGAGTENFKWGAIENIIMTLLVFALIILTVGTPDLLDAIIKRVSTCSG